MKQARITNELLNERFPLAACPLGSADDCPEHPWFIYDLTSRLRAAQFIGDEATARQLRERLAVHRACQGT